MMTLIFETTRERAEALAKLHLPEEVPLPSFRTVGRLVAIQSDFFALMGKGAIEHLATNFGLPLRSIVDRPPFGEEPEALPTVSQPRRGRPHGRQRLALLQLPPSEPHD